MTLGDARDELRQLVHDGHRCPLCQQFAKVYRRTLPSATGRTMIELYHVAGAAPDYTFLPDVLDRMTGTPHQGGYGTLGHFWGLMEREPGEREDGSDRVGWWRLTPLGVRFVLRQAQVPKYAHLYDGRCLGLHGKPISISECLGNRFNYGELMGQ